MKQNITLIVPEILKKGGIQTYMKLLCKVYTDDNYLLTIISLNDCFNELQIYFEKTSNLTLIGCSRSKFVFFKHIILSIRKKSCYIFGHINLSPLLLLLKLFDRRNQYLVVLHGFESWAVLNFLKKLSLKLSSRIVVTTKFTMNVNSKMNSINKEKYIIIPLCTLIKKSIKLNNTKNAFELNLLFVSRLDKSEKYKGLEHVLESMKILITDEFNVRLSVVGDGNDKKRFEDLSIKLNISDNVIFYGILEDSMLEKVYQKTDLYIMPSKKEGFGIVYIEAMMNSIPCIGVKEGGTPEVIIDGVNGFLVEYGDINMIVNRIKYLYLNPQILDIMSKKAQSLYKENYTFEKFKSKWENLVKVNI